MKKNSFITGAAILMIANAISKILGAFFKLVKKKTTDQITVSDIIKTAGIARSTFYNHYQDWMCS